MNDVRKRLIDQHRDKVADWLKSTPGDFWEFIDRPQDCPDAPHRGPEGPNEDMSQCSACAMPSHSTRPDGEEYGQHLPDCSLPRRHPSYCQPGGAGHPPAETQRGYWPTTKEDA